MDVKRRFPWWTIPSIVGALLVVGAGVFVAWKLVREEPRPTLTSLALGEPCVPGAAEAVPCREPGVCDPATRTCVESVESVVSVVSACTAGARQCTSNRAGIRTCGGDGTWKTAACPASTPQCRDGQCRCAPDKGKACNCGGTIQCDGTCSAVACIGACTSGRCCVFSADPACGGEQPPARKQDFNSYILQAVELLHQKHRGKGYNINTAYTHDLDYSQPGEIKAGPGAPATMCVAAVSEVIIAALKLYADAHGDRSVFNKLPARSWMKGSATDIRPYMFLYENVDSSGTADALKHFGLGEHRPFPALVPGDFIGFNRASGTGHAVVFMGFLNASGQIEPKYDSRKVVGFKYFSAQGKNPPSAGLGYRWAFFGKCPSWREADKPRDCGVIASNKPGLLNTGYMLHPTRWITTPAMRMLRTTLIQKHSTRLLAKRLGRVPTKREMLRLPRAQLRELEDQASREISKELPPVSRLRFDGATTDD